MYDPIATFTDSRGYKTMVFDNVMPDDVANTWLEQRQSVKFYKTKQQRIPMSFRVHAVNWRERKSLFNLHDWIVPYLKQWHPDLTADGFARSFINLYQKNDYIRVHADLDDRDFGDEDAYCVALVFLTPDNYIKNPQDCGFVVNNSFSTRDFVVHNKFNRLILMDARSLHEPIVPTDDVQRLTLYAGYTISPKLIKRKDGSSNESRRIEKGEVPGTQYTLELSDFIFVD